MTTLRSPRAESVPATAALAAWLADLPRTGVPENVRKALRLMTLDTLGAAVTGARQEWTDVVARWARRGALPAGKGLASVWGDSAACLRPCDAALVNGTAAHAFELDDYHNAKLHPGAVVIPAVLAVAEARGIDGPRIEIAIAAGYEVMIRTSLALDPSEARLRGWHLTAVCGTLGAAAAVAVLLGFDRQHTAWALGLAGTQSGGLFAFNADGTMSKRLHPGRAAQSGIMAAELAELGLTGPTQIYEAEDGGLLWAFSSKSSTGPLLDGLGETWHAADTSFKPYSCCGSLHSYVDAAIALRPRWKPGARVRTGVAEVVNVQCGYPYFPGSQLNAQMSIRYCTAVALMDGAALPAQFTPERIADPQLTRLAQSIEVVHDPAQDKFYPGRFAAWVELETAPGANEFVRDDRLDPSGHPRNPNREAALRAKFQALAEPALGAAAASNLGREVDSLDRASVRRLIELMAGRA
jgi:2-methylcitrate dehydratase PrpD